MTETLASERDEQERALEDSLSMASELRQRALQASQTMKQQNATLDTTSDQVDANRSKLDTVQGKLREQLAAMQSSTCWIMLMLVCVCVLFVFTFLVMKIAPKPRP